MTTKDGLIITTGDCSDFDGFLSLPLYYKAAKEKNMDVAFIMNYPAYFNNNDSNSHNKEMLEITDVRGGKPAAAHRLS